PCRTLPGRVDRLRDRLFASPRLTLDNHRDGRAREAFEHRVEATHLLACAKHASEPVRIGRLGAVHGKPLESHRGSAHTYGFARCEVRIEDCDTFDERPVRRAEVADPHEAALQLERRVTPGDLWIREPQMARRPLSDEQRGWVAAIQREASSLVWPFHDDQR